MQELMCDRAPSARKLPSKALPPRLFLLALASLAHTLTRLLVCYCLTEMVYSLTFPLQVCNSTCTVVTQQPTRSLARLSGMELPVDPLLQLKMHQSLLLPSLPLRLHAWLPQSSLLPPRPRHPLQLQPTTLELLLYVIRSIWQTHTDSLLEMGTMRASLHPYKSFSPLMSFCHSGKGFSGPTKCVSGTKCTFSNEYCELFVNSSWSRAD